MPRWFYHSTFADNVASIARKGLKPSEKSHWGGHLEEWSLGKVFFTPECSLAAHYVITMFSKGLNEFGRAPDPVLIRIDSDDLPDAIPDQRSVSGDVYVERVVSPKTLEIWTPWLGRWKALLTVGNKFEGLETVYGEPKELNVLATASPSEYALAYIEQAWPCGHLKHKQAG